MKFSYSKEELRVFSKLKKLKNELTNSHVDIEKLKTYMNELWEFKYHQKGNLYVWHSKLVTVKILLEPLNFLENLNQVIDIEILTKSGILP